MVYFLTDDELEEWLASALQYFSLPQSYGSYDDGEPDESDYDRDNQ